MRCLRLARDPALSVRTGACHGCARAGGEGPHLRSHSRSSAAMPLYVIERSIPEGLALRPTQQGGRATTAVIDNNAEFGVTWLHSYVTPDKKRTFCIYDSPTPEAIREAAERNSLPVERITEVRVLDPY